MHILFVSIVAIIIGLFAIFGRDIYNPKNSLPIPTQTATPTLTPTPKPTQEPLKQKVLLEVPFVAQAPTGKWSDPRQQDGCEEAAAYMAYLWATNGKKPASLSEQEQKITDIADWQEEVYGSYHDTSAKDTAERILKSYFEYTNFELKYDIKEDDILRALSEGNVVIAPADGQALGNPNFTPPGPERHFLLIKGYDLSTDEFITNDNGTRQGENYRYTTQVLMDALRDYPTGNHEPITGRRKAIIIVHKR